MIAPLIIRGRRLAWGERTYVMGIVNVTPDSFSGDGLLASGVHPVEAALGQARGMVTDGADLLDVGGESTRPGHAAVDEAEELRRIIPVVRAIRQAVPDTPISIDTTKPAVAEAALEAGADVLNDVWGVADSGLVDLAVAGRVPIILMHNKTEPVYEDVVTDVVDALRAAASRAIDAGVAPEALIVDPGIGFGKTPDQNLAVLSSLEAIVAIGQPVLLGTSRKSTLGRLLNLPAEERVEATVATTALGIAKGVDIVRVHDVRANVRAARTSDAIVRGWRPDGWTSE